MLWLVLYSSFSVVLGVPLWSPRTLAVAPFPERNVVVRYCKLRVGEQKFESKVIWANLNPK